MNAHIHEAASNWLIEFRTGEVDAAARERFAAWLCASPEHVRIYLELTAFWDDAGLYDAECKLDVESLVAVAREQANIVEFAATAQVERGADGPPALPRAAGKRRWGAGRAAAAAVAGLGVAIAAWLMLGNDPRYSTEVGEQRTLRLADGSTVELNALSRIRVRFSERERAIDLLAGQALFRVAKDKSRPFIVASGDSFIRAVGTQFDVSRKRSGTIVTVVEGRVAVLPHKLPPSGASAAIPAPHSIELGAGEQVTLTPAAVPQPQSANVSIVTAWTQQVLIFESMPLPEVAEEFNRFNTRQIIVESASLTGFHVSGTFPALDPASLSRFLSFLREQPGIEVSEAHDEIRIRQKQG